MNKLLLSLLLILAFCQTAQTQEITYAEKLGFPKGAKVLILHVDDVGMSWDSNQGAIDAIEKGVASSMSMMMPCPWVPGFVHYLKEKNPRADVGLHLTLTSEWKDYRWGPLSGKPAVPGLVDNEGALWASVADVLQHATADEVDTEIRAQLQRAREIGLEPTHLDSHMGTLFAKPEYMERYIRLGIENNIPVMFPAGHMTMIGKQMDGLASTRERIQLTGKMLWDAGLPVLDDLHNLSYGYNYPAKEMKDKELQQFATAQYIQTIRELKPGLTMVIMHCTSPSNVFQHISDSYKIRKGDLLAMTDPAFKAFLEKEKIIITTWREVKEKRAKIK